MENTETIQLEQHPNGITTVWLNRPEIGNALNATMIEELTNVFQTLANSSQRLVVLRGRGKNFCAGADLNWMKASVNLGFDENIADAKKLAQMLLLLKQLPTPTLAIVQGAAYAGGFGIVASCDMAIGTPRAHFCLSEVNIGLVPAMISPFVIQAVGNRYAQYLAITGARISAEDAFRNGLLTQVAEEDQLDSAIERFYQQILQCAPNAQKVCKEIFQVVGDGTITEDILHYTQNTIAAVRVSPEGQEGLKAFIEKRPPAWKA